ncbi:MAG: rhomboid family intramembrane serine protease, partial [Chromatiales bacterium]|nr:rhomboid family intramembrane serine protease [Chromatiales bacterium]
MKSLNWSKMLKRLLPPEAILLIITMWTVFIVDASLPAIDLNNLGILPRTTEGLTGVLASPFLHGGLAHIISNTAPLLILPLLIRLSVGSTQLRLVLFIGIMGSGLGTWLFGSNNLVIG